jgi:hypothetical protein
MVGENGGFMLAFDHITGRHVEPVKTTLTKFLKKKVMIEIEQVKIIGLSAAALASQFGGSALAQALPDDLSAWSEKGGTAACIFFLAYAVRALRAERDQRQKRLDEMHDREVTAAAKSAESRERLSVALDKLTDAVNKK